MERSQEPRSSHPATQSAASAAKSHRATAGKAAKKTTGKSKPGGKPGKDKTQREVKKEKQRARAIQRASVLLTSSGPVAVDDSDDETDTSATSEQAVVFGGSKLSSTYSEEAKARALSVGNEAIALAEKAVKIMQQADRAKPEQAEALRAAAKDVMSQAQGTADAALQMGVRAVLPRFKKRSEASAEAAPVKPELTREERVQQNIEKRVDVLETDLVSYELLTRRRLQDRRYTTSIEAASQQLLVSYRDWHWNAPTTSWSQSIWLLASSLTALVVYAGSRHQALLETLGVMNGHERLRAVRRALLGIVLGNAAVAQWIKSWKVRVFRFKPTPVRLDPDTDVRPDCRTQKDVGAPHVPVTLEVADGVAIGPITLCTYNHRELVADVGLLGEALARAPPPGPLRHETLLRAVKNTHHINLPMSELMRSSNVLLSTVEAAECVLSYQESSLRGANFSMPGSGIGRLLMAIGSTMWGSTLQFGKFVLTLFSSFPRILSDWIVHRWLVVPVSILY